MQQELGVLLVRVSVARVRGIVRGVEVFTCLNTSDVFKHANN